MRIQLITKQTIETYVVHNSQSRQPFQNWLVKLHHAEWEYPNDIKSTFGNADFLGKGTKRVIFNIGGNKYRMICKYSFGKTRIRLYVMWIGTHSEYSRLSLSGQQYVIDKY